MGFYEDDFSPLAPRSIPISRKSSFMSSQTSFFAAGLRSKYEGWYVQRTFCSPVFVKATAHFTDRIRNSQKILSGTSSPADNVFWIDVGDLTIEILATVSRFLRRGKTISLVVDNEARCKCKSLRVAFDRR